MMRSGDTWSNGGFRTSPLLPSSSAARGAGGALVAVDEHCAFHAESDKAYLANAAGARALFGASFDEHVESMALWLSSAPALSRERHVDLLQTEAHVQHLLQARGVEVVRADFRRTDARATARSAGALCVPAQYVHCSAALELVRSALPACAAR